MKKPIIIVLTLLVVCILSVGMLSAGMVVGGLIIANRTQTEMAEVLPPTVAEIFEKATDIPDQLADGQPSLGQEAEIDQPGTDHPDITPPPAPSEDLDELFEPFWEAWEIANSEYVDQPLDQEALMRGAIKGMLDAIGDQYTSYMDPVEYEEYSEHLQGGEEYEGIGAWVDISKDYLTIIAPFPDSPADQAGLKPGDQILAIDGEDMTGVDGELVRQRVLGPAGSTITVTVLRAGYEPFDVDVTRARLKEPSIETRMIDNEIGYVRLYMFGDNTAAELEDAISHHLEDGAQGIVLDLRYNGGGWLHAAIEVASEFLEKNTVILHEVYSDGSRDTHEAYPKGIAVDIPLVILVNEGTASASEIVAGAVQDHDRAPLVGTPTFGKGLVQTLIPLSNDQGRVRVTIAKWLTPLERQINEIGLTPDYIVGVVSQAALDEGFEIDALGIDPEDVVILSDEDITNDVDPQLDKAIEVLKGLME